MQLPGGRLVRENISIRPISLPMAESTHSVESRSTPSGHLSVYAGAAYTGPFLLERQPRRLTFAVGASFLFDVLLVLLVVLATRYRPAASETALPVDLSKNIIWLSEPGPGGGGGGGGNKMKDPPRPAELPGKDKITIPVMKPPKLEVQQVKNEPNPLDQLTIPAKSLAAAQDLFPGAIDGPPALPTLSQGSGSGGGAGTGGGPGVGPGTGSGLGPGSGGGTGGGVYQPGNGVTNPIAVLTPKPNFTSDAMRAKVQGLAVVDCVVEIDGRPSGCRIVRSLDSAFGLDQQAVLAASKWRFRPGTRLGEPVRVEITIEMAFTLR